MSLSLLIVSEVASSYLKEDTVCHVLPSAEILLALSVQNVLQFPHHTLTDLRHFLKIHFWIVWYQHIRETSACILSCHSFTMKMESADSCTTLC